MVGDKVLMHRHHTQGCLEHALEDVSQFVNPSVIGYATRKGVWNMHRKTHTLVCEPINARICDTQGCLESAKEDTPVGKPRNNRIIMRYKRVFGIICVVRHCSW